MAQDSDNALGVFLRARRRSVSPSDAGLPDNGRRRSPGLRREELATLAGISMPYYVRLEQGVDRNPSPEVIAALGRILALDEENLLYLSRLAGLTPPFAGADPEAVRPRLRRLVDGMGGPAVLVSRHREVLAANAPARMLYPGFEPGENLLRFLFCDARAPALILNWEEIAEMTLARLRVDNASEPGDARLEALIDELTVVSPQFARLWRSHPTPVPIDRHPRLDHPDLGRVTLEFERLAVADTAGQMLYVSSPVSPAAG